jgi:Coenzyme PQQ synthesis protein D (PqqD)
MAKTYQLNAPRILLQELGEEAVAYDTQANEYLSLNETMYWIVKGVENGDNEDTLCQRLCAMYEVSEGECRADLRDALAELVASNILILT